MEGQYGQGAAQIEAPQLACELRPRYRRPRVSCVCDIGLRYPEPAGPRVPPVDSRSRAAKALPGREGTPSA